MKIAYVLNAIIKASMPTPKLASTSFSLDLLTDPPVNICKPDLASPCGLESFRSLLQHHNTIQLHSENNSSLPPAHPQVIKPATKQNPFPPLRRTHPKNHPISLPLLSSHLISSPHLFSPATHCLHFEPVAAVPTAAAGLSGIGTSEKSSCLTA